MDLLRKVLRRAGSLPDRENWTNLPIDACESHTEIADTSFTWDEIAAVRAYKIDLVTTDEFAFWWASEGPEKLIELSKEQEGFETFIRIAERRLSFPEGWWDWLVKNAFETRETTLFQR